MYTKHLIPTKMKANPQEMLLQGTVLSCFPFLSPLRCSAPLWSGYRHHLHLQMRQLRYAVRMRFAQGRISYKQYSWDLNTSSLVWVMFLVKWPLLPFHSDLEARVFITSLFQVRTHMKPSAPGCSDSRQRPDPRWGMMWKPGFSQHRTPTLTTPTVISYLFKWVLSSSKSTGVPSNYFA